MSTERYQTLETIPTSEGEAVEVLYDRERRCLTVKALYGGLLLSDWPIMYRDGQVAYDHPERLSDKTRDTVRGVMTQMRYAAQSFLGV